MPPTIFPRSFFYGLVGLALPALAGCGISDYEKRMQEAEVRMDRFDAENKVLGDPLVLPPRKEKENQGPPFDAFLRPPVGVAGKENTRPGELAYHYPASGDPFTDLYLTFGNADDGRDKLERQLEAVFGAPAQNWQPVEITHLFGRPATTLTDFAEFADARAPANAPANCVAYVHQEAGQPAAAVVFRVLQAKRAAAGDAIKMSMQTYAERGDASKARATYAKPLQW